MNYNLKKYDLFIGDEKAQRKIADKLGFDFNLGSQDWEYEVSYIRKIEDYIDLYNTFDITNDERKSLMEMIFDSLEDKMREVSKFDFEQYQNFIHDSLKENFMIHKGTLVYWIESDFLISEKLKEIVKDLEVEKK